MSAGLRIMGMPGAPHAGAITAPLPTALFVIYDPSSAVILPNLNAKYNVCCYCNIFVVVSIIAFTSKMAHMLCHLGDMKMNALLEKPDTVVPSDEDARLAAESSRILASMLPEQELRVQLDDGQILTLPRAATRLLSHLLTEMAHGNAVTMIPIHAEMTTQEAADYLNVSRPHIVKLLESGVIAYHKVGSHRRIRFSELKAFKDRTALARSKALDELAAQAQELGMGY